MRRRLARLVDFFDDRTAFRRLLRAALDEEVTGGARWSYVFGSALAVIVACQLVTGLMLMLTYTPAVHGAWESVFYIQERVTMGWFVRGLHHQGANAMVLVLGMHLLQVVVHGAYKKPREVTWWVGLGLLAVVQALALTGYLLPWDQKGYWATKVATNIAGSLPLIGAQVQALVVGGTTYGQSTLTRFYALHIGLLPALLLGLITLHVALFRKNGVTAAQGAPRARSEPFWPGQVARDVAFAVLVLGVMAALTTLSHGAPLDAPADPVSDYPPRPDWYFLSLFQLLKYLPGSWDLVGAVLLPGLAGVLLFVLPLLDRKESRRARHRLPFVAPIFAGLCGVAALTWLALADDAGDPEYLASRADADARAGRAAELARRGIPPGGAVQMLYDDPMTRGRDLYGRYCLGCHTLAAHGLAAVDLPEREEEDPRGPEHGGYGSRAWLHAVMVAPQDEHLFGGVGLEENMKSMSRELSDEQLWEVAEFVFSLGREPQDPALDEAKAERGRAHFERKCMTCHVFGDDGDFLDVGGPNLTRYGSRTWIYRQVSHPQSETQYGTLNDMPPFFDQLSEHDLRMVTAFLRRQRFEEPDFEVEPGAGEPPRR